eukprot:TRINITY_DN2178_c0_g1_i1.p1 TRINITY_DN2178_c0_g1~~TRINITY_DN2178_c0_g1_i1.p1  ORF type:complete len:260 (+),score=53.97 TRINITY_DN2178_c0_g1_i1:62-781(+)
MTSICVITLLFLVMMTYGRPDSTTTTTKGGELLGVTVPVSVPALGTSSCQPAQGNSGTICTFNKTVRETLVSLSEGTWAVDELIHQIRRIAKENNYKAVFFETPMVVLDRQFEFAVLDASNTGLDDRAPGNAFVEYCTGDDVVAFPTPRGDAQLVVPCEKSEKSCYPHLLRVIGTTNSCVPESQLLLFWKLVGSEALKKSATEPHLWLSTSGLGVSWLHFRLDTTPKYYTYVPYKTTEP